MDALRPLSLDQFAAMTAEMEAGFPRDRVLDGAAVSPEQWELTQETWLLRMAKQGSQRKLALLDRYNELLAKHRKTAQRKMRAEKRKLKGPMPVAPEAFLSPLARGKIDDGTGATFQRSPFGDGAERPAFAAQAAVGGAPSWLAAGAAQQVVPAPMPVTMPVTVPAIPHNVTAPPMAAPQPVMAPPMTAPPQPVMAPQPVTAAPSPWAAEARSTGAGARIDADVTRDDDDDDDIGMTAIAPAISEEMLAAATGPAWLASQRSAAEMKATAPAEPSPIAAALKGPAWLQSTGGFPGVKPQPPARPAAPQAAPIPGAPAWLQSSAGFQGVTPQPPAATAPASVPPPAPQAPRAAPSSPGATAPAPPPIAAAPAATPPSISLSQTVGEPVMSPFAGPAWIAAQKRMSEAAAAAPAQPAGATSSSGLPFQRVSTATNPAGMAQAVAAAQAQAQAQTAAAAQAAAQAPAVQPKKASPSQPGGPRLTVEQLAWLQAQVETSPELGRSAREQLGLSEPDYAAERAFWQARFQQDRATLDRYSQLFYHYRRGR